MKPLPFREVKRKLEAAGFVEVGQTGSHTTTPRGLPARGPRSNSQRQRKQEHGLRPFRSIVK